MEKMKDGAQGEINVLHNLTEKEKQEFRKYLKAGIYKELYQRRLLTKGQLEQLLENL